MGAACPSRGRLTAPLRRREQRDRHQADEVLLPLRESGDGRLGPPGLVEPGQRFARLRLGRAFRPSKLTETERHFLENRREDDLMIRVLKQHAYLRQGCPTIFGEVLAIHQSSSPVW